MDDNIIACLRGLDADVITNANNIYSYESLKIAPTLYTIFNYFLKFSINKTTWINRDRFVVCGKDDYPLLLSMRFLCGYKIMLKDLKNINSYLTNLKTKRINSKYNLDDILNNTDYPYAVSVGVSLAEDYLRSVISRELFDFYTYSLIKESELFKGINYESLTLVSNKKLKKLITITYTDSLDNTNREMFKLLGFNLIEVDDGEDINKIINAIKEAKKEKSNPSIIRIKTNFNFDIKNEEDVIKYKTSKNLNTIPFFVLKEPVLNYREKLNKRINELYEAWNNKYELALSKVNPKIHALLENIVNGDLKINVTSLKLDEKDKEAKSLYDYNRVIMNILSEITPLFLVGTYNDSKYTKGNHYLRINGYGRNISFDDKCLAIPYILNGLSTLNLKCFMSCPLDIFGYMKVGIKEGSKIKIPVSYIFREGENTNVLTELRTLNNMYVFKPNDLNELLGSLDFSFNSKKSSSIILPKNISYLKEFTNKNNTLKGGYIYKEASLSKLELVIIASGKELDYAIDLKERLLTRRISARVVSMPSLNIFLDTDITYRESIIPSSVKRIVLEEGNDYTWYNIIPNMNYLINVNDYMEEDKLNYEMLCSYISSLINKK